MELAAVLAFIKAIQPLIPLAIWGITEAKEAVEWSLDTLKKQNAEGRGPTQEEWDKLNAYTASLRERLHSDNK